jgi:hypothetical protein
MRRVFILALCCLCPLGCVSVNKGSRPLGSIVEAEQPTPEPGQWCRVTYPKQGTDHNWGQQQLTGRVEAVDDDGIHLSEVVVHGRQVSGTPVLSRLPYVSRYFKNTGVGMERSDTTRIIRPDECERLEIITKQEAWQPEAQLVAQHLANAVPGRNRGP